MKPQAYNSALNYSKERSKLSVSNLKAYQSNSNKLSAAYTKPSVEALAEETEGHRKSGQSYSSATNSSIYASKRGKRISDLNNSTDKVKMTVQSNVMTLERDTSKSTYQKIQKEDTNDTHIPVDIRNERRRNNLPAGKNNLASGEQDNGGLDHKYIVRSIGSNEDSEALHNAQQDAARGNLASNGGSSNDSVPDEYGTQHRKRPNKQFKADKVQNSNGRKDQYNHTKIKLQSNGRNNNVNGAPMLYNRNNEDEEFEEWGDEASTMSEGSYSLHIPSMITHLKRKDNYLDSLDTFLNENLTVISDLMKIK